MLTTLLSEHLLSLHITSWPIFYLYLVNVGIFWPICIHICTLLPHFFLSFISRPNAGTKTVLFIPLIVGSVTTLWPNLSIQIHFRSDFHSALKLVADILKSYASIGKIVYRNWRNCIPVLAKSYASIGEIIYQYWQNHIPLYWLTVLGKGQLISLVYDFVNNCIRFCQYQYTISSIPYTISECWQ